MVKALILIHAMQCPVDFPADPFRSSSGHGWRLLEVELDEGAGLALAIKWMRRALYQTDLSAADLKIAAQKALAQAPSALFGGSTEQAA